MQAGSECTSSCKQSIWYPSLDMHATAEIIYQMHCKDLTVTSPLNKRGKKKSNPHHYRVPTCLEYYQIISKCQKIASSSGVFHDQKGRQCRCLNYSPLSYVAQSSLYPWCHLCAVETTPFDADNC